MNLVAEIDTLRKAVVNVNSDVQRLLDRVHSLEVKVGNVRLDLLSDAMNNSLEMVQNVNERLMALEQWKRDYDESKKWTAEIMAHMEQMITGVNDPTNPYHDIALTFFKDAKKALNPDQEQEPEFDIDIQGEQE